MIEDRLCGKYLQLFFNSVVLIGVYEFLDGCVSVHNMLTPLSLILVKHLGIGSAILGYFLGFGEGVRGGAGGAEIAYTVHAL